MIGIVGAKVAVIVVLGLVGLAGLVRRTRSRAVLRAKLEAAPSEFEDNAVVTLTGTVKQLAEPLLVAPLSGRPCVAFRAVARSYTMREPGSAVLVGLAMGAAMKRVRVLDREVESVEMVPFVLATKTGDVIVDGTTCELLVAAEPIIPRKLEREKKFLAAMQLETAVRDAGFDESRVEVGAKIKVHGVSRSELAAHGGETGFREAPTRIRLTGDDAHPLTIDRA
jgi:hypothetical protein